VIELALVLGVLVALIGSAALLSYASWVTVFGAGLSCVALGLTLGVPTGVYYHVLLYRALQPRGQLTRLWWLHPVGRHHALAPTELVRVRRWFVAGAIGFGLCVLGCLLTALGAWRSI
jgi:hypothetical protein